MYDISNWMQCSNDLHILYTEKCLPSGSVEKVSNAYDGIMRTNSLSIPMPNAILSFY